MILALEAQFFSSYPRKSNLTLTQARREFMAEYPLEDQSGHWHCGMATTSARFYGLIAMSLLEHPAHVEAECKQAEREPRE